MPRHSAHVPTGRFGRETVREPERDPNGPKEIESIIHISGAPPGWRADPQFVYIGPGYPKLDGYFGNPFRKGCNDDPEELNDRFRAYAHKKFEYDRDYRHRIMDLAGKILVCYCPSECCHGKVLAELCLMANSRGGRQESGIDQERRIDRQAYRAATSAFFRRTSGGFEIHYANYGHIANVTKIEIEEIGEEESWECTGIGARVNIVGHGPKRFFALREWFAEAFKQGAL